MEVSKQLNSVIAKSAWGRVAPPPLVTSPQPRCVVATNVSSVMALPGDKFGLARPGWEVKWWQERPGRSTSCRLQEAHEGTHTRIGFLITQWRPNLFCLSCTHLLCSTYYKHRAFVVRLLFYCNFIMIHYLHVHGVVMLWLRRDCSCSMRLCIVSEMARLGHT